MWVGLEIDTRGTWKWLGDGSALTRRDSSWAVAQPDGTANTDGCIEMWDDATWNDRACQGDFYTNKVCACEVPL